ncbi:hypothetical protein U1Q18_051855, partial [Sarracenia purpurea var. burkii]
LENVKKTEMKEEKNAYIRNITTRMSLKLLVEYLFERINVGDRGVVDELRRDEAPMKIKKS